MGNCEDHSRVAETHQLLSGESGFDMLVHETLAIRDRTFYKWFECLRLIFVQL